MRGRFYTLKFYREKLGVTGQEMEWRTGITKRHWSYYESGTHEPKVSLAQRMVVAFNDIAMEKGIELKKLSVDDLYPPIDFHKKEVYFTYSNEGTRDTKAMVDDIFDFTARAFCIPPALLRGDIR